MTTKSLDMELGTMTETNLTDMQESSNNNMVVFQEGNHVTMENDRAEDCTTSSGHSHDEDDDDDDDAHGHRHRNRHRRRNRHRHRHVDGTDGYHQQRKNLFTTFFLILAASSYVSFKNIRHSTTVPMLSKEYRISKHDGNDNGDGTAPSAGTFWKWKTNSHGNSNGIISSSTSTVTTSNITIATTATTTSISTKNIVINHNRHHHQHSHHTQQLDPGYENDRMIQSKLEENSTTVASSINGSTNVESNIQNNNKVLKPSFPSWPPYNETTMMKQKIFWNYLSHIPKSGASYALSTINKLLWPSDEFQSLSLQQRFRSCNVGIIPPKQFRDRYAMKYKKLPCTLWMSESPPTFPVRSDSTHTNDPSSQQHQHQQQQKEQDPSSAAKKVYTILRNPRQHVLSQYFHCTESDDHSHLANQMPNSLDEWLQGWLNVVDTSDGIDNVTVTTTTSTSSSISMEQLISSLIPTIKQKKLKRQQQCYNPYNLQSHFVLSWLKYEKLGQQHGQGQGLGPDKQSSSSSSIQFNNEILPLLSSLPSIPPLPQTLSASNTVQQEQKQDDKDRQNDHRSLEVEEEIVLQLLQRFDIIGDNSQMVTTICSIFIHFTGWVPYECDCSMEMSSGYDNNNDNIDENFMNDETKQRQNKNYRKNVDRANTTNSDSSLSSVNDGTVSLYDDNGTDNNPSRRRDLAYRPNEHAHGVKHHGATYATTSWQKDVILKLTKYDEWLYTIMKEIIFPYQVRQIENHFHIVLCKTNFRTRSNTPQHGTTTTTVG